MNFLKKIKIPLSRVDFILLCAVGQIGAGIYLQLGIGPALSVTGCLFLAFGLLMARGETK